MGVEALPQPDHWQHRQDADSQLLPIERSGAEKAIHRRALAEDPLQRHRARDAEQRLRSLGEGTPPSRIWLILTG